MTVDRRRKPLETSRCERARARSLDRERQVGDARRRSLTASSASLAAALEPRDELVEPQLLEALADRLELARAELDELAALRDELERLAQAGLAGVQPPDDLLDARAVAVS